MVDESDLGNGNRIKFAILFTAADSFEKDADDENSVEDPPNEEGMKDEDQSGECVFCNCYVGWKWMKYNEE